MAGMYPDNQELDIFGEKVQWPGVDSSGKFSNGSFKNPLEKPSFIPAETINLILDNLSELIKKLGGTPNNTSTTQLSDLMSLASQGDSSDRDKQKGIGLVKTVNRTPNAQECEKNEPWAASPNWVYNLLTGNAAGDVNEEVTKALRQRLISWKASQGDFSDEDQQKGIGLVKTVNRAPNAQECQKNEPWVPSPNWVYNLLTGGAQDDVNEEVTKALRNRVAAELFCGAPDSGISCAITIRGHGAFGPNGEPVHIDGYRWAVLCEIPLEGLYIDLWVLEKI